MSETIDTQDPEANAAIAKLREAATYLKALGDQHADLKRERDEARTQLAAYEEELSVIRDSDERLKQLMDAVADLGRGIRDQDEVVALAQRLDPWEPNK